MEGINFRLLAAMMRDANAISGAENSINNAIRSGQYIAIELSDGSIVRLNQPIKIHNIDIIGEDGRWNLAK